MGDADTYCKEQHGYDNCTADYAMGTAKHVANIVQYITPLQQPTAVTGAQNILDRGVKDFCCMYRARKNLQTRIDRTQNEYSTAKHRVDVTRDPAADVYDRGTTFPFGRPLRSSSVLFLLITISVFAILSLALLLDLGNIQLIYRTTGGFGPSIFERVMDSFRQTSWLLILVIVGISGGIAIGIYFAIAKTHPEWLGLK